MLQDVIPLTFDQSLQKSKKVYFNGAVYEQALDLIILTSRSLCEGGMPVLACRPNVDHLRLVET